LLAALGRDDGALDTHIQRETRARRIDTIAHAIGAIMLSRACPDDSPLADEILEVCRSAILSQLPAPAQA
jgi:TetR/AcrR family transcriptional repressor of nem operon